MLDYVLDAPLAGRRLDSITPDDLDTLFAVLLANGRRTKPYGALSPRTVRLVATVLGRALDDAVRRGQLRANPVKLAHPPSSKAAAAEERPIWTPAETGRFLTTAADDPLLPLWRTLATCGLRRGEALGLTWSALDLDGGVLHIRQQLTIRREPGKSERLELTAPKTEKGRRRVDLDDGTVTALRAHRTQQRRQQLAVGPGWRNSERDLVFVGPAGEPLHPEWVGDRFQRLAKAAGLPVLTLHGLRHSHCTALLLAGMSPVLVSRRLGHSSPAFTLSRYGHVVPDEGRAAAQAAAAYGRRSLIEPACDPGVTGEGTS